LNEDFSRHEFATEDIGSQQPTGLQLFPIEIRKASGPTVIGPLWATRTLHVIHPVQIFQMRSGDE
jgi:hypothetical protein